MVRDVTIGVAVAVVLVLMILAVALSTQKQYFRVGEKPPGGWEVRLGTLHKMNTEVRTVKLNEVTTLIVKGDRIYVKVNTSKFRELWLSENKGFCKIRECDAFNNCKCYGYSRIVNATFNTYRIWRDLTYHGVLVRIRIPVVIPEQAITDSNETVKAAYIEKLPTLYQRVVIAPLLKYLSSSPKELANNILDLIAQSGYSGASYVEPDKFLVKGGVCEDWAGYASTLARLFGLRVLDLGVITSEAHTATALCNYTWWKNDYGLRFYFRNGTVLECYIWVDTGSLIEYWKSFYLNIHDTWYGETTIDRYGGGLVKVEKLVNGVWVKVYSQS